MGDLDSIFRNWLTAADLNPATIIMDGKLHRCPTIDKPHGNDGAYVAHADEPATLWLQNHRTGQADTYTVKSLGEMSRDDRDTYKRRLDQGQAVTEQQRAVLHAEKAKLAQRLFEQKASPCPKDHPYLVKKGVPPLGNVKAFRDGGRLVVPLRDADGKIQSLHFIAEDGQKRFLAGAKKTGGFFTIAVADATAKADGPLYLVEGYATGASIHQTTGAMVVVAFDAGNLLPVAKTLRELHPKREIILCADDDQATTGNPGMTKATEAAKAISARLAIPSFLDHAEKSDFNDMHREQGAEAVKAALAAAKPAVKPQETGPKADQSVRPFRFLTLAEILSAPCRTNWLVGKYLEAGILAVLFGEPGSMKSFLAIDLGLSIATGKSWHGHACPDPGPVFYIAGEGHGGLGKRFKAWTIAHNVPFEDIPFFTSEAPAQFLDKDHAQAVSEAVADMAAFYGDPKLVIIDTLSRNFGCGDESATRDMSAFVAAMDTLKARFKCAVLVVHHNGLQDKSRSRGSGVLRGAADIEYRQTVKDSVRVLSCTKNKDHEPPVDLVFKPEIIEILEWGADPDTGEPMRSCVLRLSDALQKDEKGVTLTKPQRIALEALTTVCERSDGPCTIADWRDEACSRGVSTAASADAKRKAFRRAKDDLVENGLVRVTGDLYTPIAETDNDSAEHEPFLPNATGQDRPRTDIGPSGSIQ